jgi:hypothetical protein
MRTIMCGVVGGILLAGVVGGVDLGAVSTADYLRFEVQALDSAGIPVAPDSGHVLVWYVLESSADAASYTGRWTNAGASGAYIDSARFAGHTYYYFVDQVADIDNDEGQGIYTGAVVLYADFGLPTSNRFAFTLTGDELADYLARLDNLDEPISGIDDNPWNNADRQLTALDEDYTAIDLEGSVGGGSGVYSVTLVAYDTTKSLTVPGACISVRNPDQTALLASVVTGATGRASANLEAGTYVIAATAPGYMFEAYDTVSIESAESDTSRGAWFDPGTPGSPSLCRVYGYLYSSDGRAEAGATISAWLPNGVTSSGGVIVSPTPVTTTVTSLGYFYFDLVPSSLLAGRPKYEIAINRSDGTILRKRLLVPDEGNWQLSW